MLTQLPLESSVDVDAVGRCRIRIDDLLCLLEHVDTANRQVGAVTDAGGQPGADRRQGPDQIDAAKTRGRAGEIEAGRASRR